MARRVFLHVGAMKSATSYLQALVDCNRSRLFEQGMLWTRSNENFLATDDLLGTRRERPGLEGAWARMSAQLERHDGDALISNELLAPIRPRKRERLVSALSPAEAHVVVSARDIARVIPSQWQTGARNRKTERWDDYVRALVADDGNDVAEGFWRRQDIARIVRGWAEQVPIENIAVVTVPQSGVPAEVVGERFASAIGVDATGFEQPPYTNPSVGTLSAELLRRVNERTSDLEWNQYRWGFKHALARFVLAPRAVGEPSIRLDAATYRWAHDRARQLADAIEATGVRVVGDVADLVPSAEPPASVSDAAQNATDAELLDAAVDALTGLGVEYAAARIEHEALVRAVEQWVHDEVTDADWEAFAEYERTLPEPPGEQMVASRFLRWRLAR